MQLTVSGNGLRDLRTLSAQIKQVSDPKQVRKDLTKGLRQGAKPAAVAVKAAAKSLPAKSGGKATGLRRRMASAAGVQVRTSGQMAGVRVRVSRARMGEQASLAKVTNEGSWRHPVYGNRHVWVVQRSRRGWFDSATARSAPAVRKALKKVLDDTERKLRSRRGA
jgi:hypothetical protein